MYRKLVDMKPWIMGPKESEFLETGFNTFLRRACFIWPEVFLFQQEGCLERALLRL